ncbi:RidA family protein [Arcicella aquatica]|uniref:RidA family protein n=1 Tax=Arcicella aquatica TaxID=217141 RepID=A0ABU5QRH4_9BACT|nr:RidA family protein [Arcicella aquatica]MEA5259695.1 RidA family protein [Arcicella aquatica]
MKKILLFLALFLSLQTFAQTPEENLAKLGITLPAVGQPIASYVNVVRTGNLLFLSGKGPLKASGEYITGKLGKDLTIEEGAKAAELAATHQLAVLKATLVDLSKVKRIVKIVGFVNSDSQFFDHPKVINGCSNLMIQVFGEKGKHARSALGVSALPLNMSVEIEMVVEVE